MPKPDATIQLREQTPKTEPAQAIQSPNGLLSGVLVPEGYVLVAKDSPEAKVAKDQARLLAMVKKVSVPMQERVQAILDEKYPPGSAPKTFSVFLDDKNCHPLLRVPAVSGGAAMGIYMEICGIRGVDEAEEKFVISEIKLGSQSEEAAAA